METIYSLVTKAINQNVAIIRISGPETFVVIKNIIKGFNPEANKVVAHKLFDGDEYVDDVLILTFANPNSFTGEDIIEIQSHGNIFVVKKILSMIEKEGARQSNPGEFMEQAFMNGKIDLTQSEAINTLILSEDEQLTKQASKNLDGQQSKVINNTISELTDILSRIKVSIDYPENQDLPEYSLEKLGEDIGLFVERNNKIIKQSKNLVKYSKGIKVALIGKPNAGKSSLLNALLDEERAIVSDIQGTTRDVVESTIYLNGVKVTFQDTAGLRETDDQIEQAGIKKTIETLEKADIVISIEESSNRIDYNELSKYEHKIIKIANKSDVKSIDGYINISALKKDIEPLVEELNKYISEKVILKDVDEAILITQNQIDQFEDINNNLAEAKEMIDNKYQADVVALEIEAAVKKLGKILGIEIDHEYLTNLFANFCIGK